LRPAAGSGLWLRFAPRCGSAGASRRGTGPRRGWSVARFACGYPSPLVIRLRADGTGDWREVWCLRGQRADWLLRPAASQAIRVENFFKAELNHAMAANRFRVNKIFRVRAPPDRHITGEPAIPDERPAARPSERHRPPSKAGTPGGNRPPHANRTTDETGADLHQGGKAPPGRHLGAQPQPQTSANRRPQPAFPVLRPAMDARTGDGARLGRPRNAGHPLTDPS
jgi:hypothetical protein